MEAPKWGRVAVGRFTKTAEEIQAEIIKSLEGKLSVEFKDYSQWQRVALLPPTPPTKPVAKKKKTIVKAEPIRPLTGKSGTSCSSLCLHPWNKVPPPIDRTAEIRSKDRCDILQIQIDAKKKSYDQYKTLQRKLAKQNAKYKAEMEGYAGETHKAVTEYLEQYEKYTGAAKTLRKNHYESKTVSTAHLNLLKTKLDKEIKDIQTEVATINGQLTFLLKDLQVLRTYKDKEYPVKAMQIAKLRKELTSVKNEQKMETDELNRIINGERVQLMAKHVNQSNTILQDSADSKFAAMVPPGIVNMRWHSGVLEDDIATHKSAIAKLLYEIDILESEIYELKQQPETNPKKFVFPELCLPNKKCHPEEEIKLNIPMMEVLPI